MAVQSVSGHYGYSSTRISSGLDAGATIDASGASWTVANSRNSNPVEGHGADTGDLPINRYPFAVINAASGLIIKGGLIYGEVPQNSDWTWTYQGANSAAVRVEDAPGATIQDWRITKPWDGIRVTGASNGFTIAGAWISDARDDAVENDYTLSGTIRDSLFDGVFSGISLGGAAGAVDGSGNTVTFEGMLLRSKSYLSNGEMTHGSPIKTHSAAFETTPHLRFINTVIAIEDPNHNGQHRLQNAWDETIESSGNTFLNLSDTPLSDSYPKPGAGWTILEGEAARDYWNQARSTWIANHPAAPLLDLDDSAGGTGYAAAFTEDQGAVAVAGIGAFIGDADDTHVEGLTVALANARAGDQLLVNVAGLPAGISVSPLSTAATVILIGSAGIADYKAALRQVLFNNTSNNPDPTPRGIDVTVNDGAASSSPAVATIAITPQNDAPTAANGAIVTAEDRAIIAAPLPAATDLDGDAVSFALGATGPASGTVAVYADGAFDYTPHASFNGADRFSFVVSDGRGGSNEYIQRVTVGLVNTAATGELALGDTSPTEGQTLLASPGSIADINGTANADFAYQWQVSDGTQWTDIAGAASPSFTPTQAEVARPLRVVARFTDDQGTPETVSSAPTTVVGDRFTSDAGGQTFTGTAGDDVASTGGDGDVLNGHAGDDILKGGAGSDRLDGGAGADAASYAGSHAGVTVDLATGAAWGGHAAGDTLTTIENLMGSAHADVLTGNAGNNVLHGGLADDTLVGGGGNDTLAGDDGNDTLSGGVGADALRGGAGSDAASYAGSTAAVTVNLATGARAGGHAAGDTLTGIENLIGSAHGDTLAGNAGNNVLDGGLANDALFGGGGNDTLAGGEGHDTLGGGAGADALDGGAGSDAASYAGSTAGVTVNLATGAASGGDAAGDILRGIENLVGSAYLDLLYGDAGNNTLTGGATADALIGGAGLDTANYSTSASGVTVDLQAGTASGGDAAGDAFSSIENLNGSAHADTLTGNAGSNALTGGTGNDRLGGFDGNDTLWGGAGGDSLLGGFGIDTASYGGSTAGVTVDLASGTASGGHAEGDTFAGIENVLGSAHADTLTGDAGNNVLNGGGGSDVLAGGAGLDVFVFNTALGAANVDLITDFAVANDTLRLDDAVFTALTAMGALSAAAFRRGAAAGDADDRIVYNSTTGALYYDADGTGAIGQVQFATLATYPAGVTNVDFLVI